MILLHLLIAVFWIIGATAYWKIHPLPALLAASLYVGWSTGFSLLETLSLFGTGFGQLIGQIGLMLIAGCILGYLLEKSGAATRIAYSLLMGIGKRFPAWSTAAMGTLVGVPVFCDSGFILLQPLSKHLAKLTRMAAITFSLCLASGLYLAHILLPPTPGPLALAGIFTIENQLGLLLFLGLLLLLPTLSVSVLWALRFKNSPIDHADIDAADVALPEKVAPKPLPTLFWSAAALGLPLLCIALGNMHHQLTEGPARELLHVLGQPLIAMSLGIGLGAWRLKGPGKKNLLPQALEEGIRIAGPILILTGAGAGFGALLQKIGLQDLLAQLDWEVTSIYCWLLIAFGLSAFLKTAQGSSTSAMVIGGSLLVSILPLEMQSPLQASLFVLAIGAGAMCISHANDSYFWIVKSLTGMDMRQALLRYSLMTLLLGLSCLASLLVLTSLLDFLGKIT
ncbi:MAG: GntP family permease [Nitritalea sp.]